MKFRTKSIHAGEKPNYKEGGTGDAVMPIHLSTTFARKELETPTGGFEYARSQNPSRKAVETKFAALEDAKYGLGFSSGMAAESTILLALVKSGDHIVCMDDIYGGTQRLFKRVFAEKYNVKFSFVDATKNERVEEAIQDNTALIWIETPTNPLLKVCDIAGIAKIAKEKRVLLAVDNTFMSPYFQNPLKLGADIVMHSTSKYINGHSDSIGGAVMCDDTAIYEQIKFMQNAVGAIMSPFDCYLIARGIKTLGPRMEQHQKNAIYLAKILEAHPKVNKVMYPGLESHPQHALAKEQARGFGAVISFEIKGDAQNAKNFLESLQHILLAESLGGVESLIGYPAQMTHASVPAAEKIAMGITDNLIRFSVGIEDPEDLKKDLLQALDKA
jgi:cystathionine gamma-lyase